MTKDELREKANDLPLQPGVYLMMDKTGKVIYVGKAKKLKNRVSQYFQDSAAHSVKTRQMVSQVDHFDTIFVTSEFEALVLENSLIKRHMPRYNILLKDDKGYPLVRLSRREVLRSLWRAVRDPSGSGCGMSGFAPAHLPPTVSAGHRRGAALPEFPHGPVRRVLPPGDAGGGI